MYNSILFATLQLHAGQDTEAHTLSKTLAVYQNGSFDFSKLYSFESSRKIRNTIGEFAAEARGNNNELYPYFTWHLN